MCTLISVHGTNSRCFRHLFSLNKWKYHDEYIIAIMVLQEKSGRNYDLKTAKKWQEWCSNLRLPATMPVTLVTELLGHLVAAADQAYLIDNRCAYLLYCLWTKMADPAFHLHGWKTTLRGPGARLNRLPSSISPLLHFSLYLILFPSFLSVSIFILSLPFHSSVVRNLSWGCTCEARRAEIQGRERGDSWGGAWASEPLLHRSRPMPC